MAILGLGQDIPTDNQQPIHVPTVSVTSSASWTFTRTPSGDISGRASALKRLWLFSSSCESDIPRENDSTLSWTISPPHQTDRVLRWARDEANNMTFAWTPTNASWLNHIECRFTDIKNSVFTNTYYQSHTELYKAINDYIRYRNKYKKTSEKRH
jgi:hypothetical protein